MVSRKSNLSIQFTFKLFLNIFLLTLELKKYLTHQVFFKFQLSFLNLIIFFNFILTPLGSKTGFARATQKSPRGQAYREAFNPCT